MNEEKIIVSTEEANNATVNVEDIELAVEQEETIEYIEVEPSEEIVIDKDGVCHYAVPSHNGILEMMVCKKHKIKFEWFNFSEKAGALCPKNMYADYPEWLCKETGCIMVWGDPTNKILGKPNEKQLETLKLLEKE